MRSAVSEASSLQRQLGSGCRSVVREAPRLFRTQEMPKLLKVPETPKLLEAECSSMRSVAREASSLQRQLGSGYRSVKIVVKKAAGEAQKLLKVPQVKPSEIPGVKPPESTKKVLSMDVLEKVASGADDAPKSRARLAAEREAFEKMLSDAEKKVAKDAAQAAKAGSGATEQAAKGLDGNVAKVTESVTGEVAKVIEVEKDVTLMENPYSLNLTHSQTRSKSKMLELISDIEKNGIREPIKYVEYKGEKYVVDGHHRLIAAKKLKLKSVPIQKVDLPYAGYNCFDDLFWD